MPTLAAGNVKSQRPNRGFTLLELLVVLAILAFASLGVGFALRDSTQLGLEREALRLAALLESARARSQASGVMVRWHVTADGFLFDGLPPQPDPKDELPRQWELADTVAQVIDASRSDGLGAALVLGPEPIIAPQTVRLFSRSRPAQEIVLVTDGVRPFAVQQPSP